MNIEQFPSRIVLELTPLCNLSCFMCPRHYIKKTDGYMSESLFKKLVDEIEAENRQAIVLPFWRGESCLHPQFLELLGYAQGKGLRIHLSTNGLFMEPAFRDVFYRCEFVTFSIHNNQGYRNAVDFVQKKPDWSRVTTQISFVDSEKTTRKYLADCSGAKGLKGFDSIRLYVEHTVGGEFGKNGVPKVAVERFFCPKLTHTLVISADGGFSRCNHIWEPEQALNLASATIKDVWGSLRMKEIRETYPDERCTPCDQWSGHTNGKAWRRLPDGQIEYMEYGMNHE